MLVAPSINECSTDKLDIATGTNAVSKVKDTCSNEKCRTSRLHNLNEKSEGKVHFDFNPNSYSHVHIPVPVEVISTVLEYAQINHEEQRRSKGPKDKQNEGQQQQQRSNSDSFTVSHIDALRNVLDACTQESTHPSGIPPSYVIQYAKQKLHHVCHIDLSHTKSTRDEWRKDRGSVSCVLTSTFVSIFSHRLKSINLSHCGLGGSRTDDDDGDVCTCILTQLFQCRHLEELMLVGNDIRLLPDDIGNLIHLKRLDLSENQMKYLPRGLTDLRQSLIHLDVSHNQLVTLYTQPNGKKRTRIIEEYLERHTEQNEADWSEVWDEEGERTIYFNKRTRRSTAIRPNFSTNSTSTRTSTGDVEMSPEEQKRKLLGYMKPMVEGMEWEVKLIEDKERKGSKRIRVRYYNHLSGEYVEESPEVLDCIGNLKGLRQLNIGNNCIDELPMSMGDLSFLELLDLSRNQISDITNLMDLSKLKYLDVSKNKIQEIPVGMKATALCEFDVSHNRLELFPAIVLKMRDLVRFDMSVNSVRKIPYDLGFLRNLKYLNANDNPIIDPPYNLMIQAASNAGLTLWTLRELSARGRDHNHSSNDLSSLLKGSTDSVVHLGPPIVHRHTSGICLECSTLEPDFQARSLELVEEAKNSPNNGYTYLNWQFRNLSWIPSEVFDESSVIERIDASHNALLGKREHNGLTWSHPVVSLKSLILKNCQLGMVSKSIHYLTNLARLDLEDNSIEIIPEEVSHLAHLEHINLKKNQIKVIPSSLGRLKELTELHVDSNELCSIPETIHLCKKLEVFTASHNKIATIVHAITDLPRLKTLDLGSNEIKNIPNFVGDMDQLVRLSISNNQINLLEEDCFCPKLCSRLQILEINDNNVEVLPGSFGKLKCLRFLDLNRNPLISPPMALGSEGIEAIIKYCAARELFIQGIMRQLHEAGFGTSRSNFSPPARCILVDGTSYLSQQDLFNFDQIIDKSVNGSFYNKTTQNVTRKIVKDIRELRGRRDRETQKLILDTILDVIRHRLGLMRAGSHSKSEGSFLILDNIEHRFNLLEGKVECYATPLDEVLIPETEVIEPVTVSILQEVKNALSTLDSVFNFSNHTLLWALKYVSPFGRVSIQERITYKRLFKKKSLVIAKHIYSDEEANRRNEEEDILKVHFTKMIQKIDEWANSKPGRRSINTEVASRMRAITRDVPRAKQAIEKYRTKSKEDQKKMQKRYDNYKAKKPLRYHLIKSDEDAERIRIELERYPEKIKAELIALEVKYKEARSRKFTMLPKEDMEDILVQQMKRKCCFFLFEKVYRNGRAYALSNGLKRPWEFDEFNAYKVRCDELEDSRVVVDRIALVQQLEQCIDCTSLLWTNMDDMSAYDCKIYDKFNDGSLINKAKDLLKGG